MQHDQKPAKATEIIRNHVGFALGAALIPFPGADLVAVSGVQLNMLRQLAKLYQVSFMDTLGKNIISAVVSGSVARLGASLIKVIPGVGTIIGELSMPALSGASTYALGRVLANHFHKGGTLEDFDFKSARKRYKAEMKEGKNVAENLNAAAKAEGDANLDKLRQLAEMRDAGVISEEEFQVLKEKILARL